jgi:hypothetical protein
VKALLTLSLRVAATFVAAVVLLAPAVAGARPDMRSDPPNRSSVRSIAATGASRSTTVMGAAWNVNNTPIPAARVQLRNVVTGKIAGTAVADDAGRFSFTSIESGTYVVELVGANGKILTVGHAFAVGSGETVATFVRLAAQTPWYAGFFSNAAAAAASTAASYGITAMAPVQLPVSAR